MQGEDVQAAIDETKRELHDCLAAAGPSETVIISHEGFGNRNTNEGIKEFRDFLFEHTEAVSVHRLWPKSARPVRLLRPAALEGPGQRRGAALEMGQQPRPSRRASPRHLRRSAMRDPHLLSGDAGRARRDRRLRGLPAPDHGQAPASFVRAEPSQHVSVRPRLRDPDGAEEGRRERHRHQGLRQGSRPARSVRRGPSRAEAEGAGRVAAHHRRPELPGLERPHRPDAVRRGAEGGSSASGLGEHGPDHARARSSRGSCPTAIPSTRPPSWHSVDRSPRNWGR